MNTKLYKSEYYGTVMRGGEEFTELFYWVHDPNKAMDKRYSDYRIPVSLFSEKMGEFGKTETDVIFEHAQPILKMTQQARERFYFERFHHGHKINNVKELMLHIKTLISGEQWAEIQKKAEGIKNMQDVIKLFPEIYQPLLRWKYLEDKKMAVDKKAEIKSLEKTIINKTAFEAV